MVILKFGRRSIQHPSKRKIGWTNAADRVHGRGVFRCGPFSVAYQARSEAGNARTRNEDSLIVSPSTGLFGVCDGMGRHPAGEVARQITASTLVENLGQCPNCPERELRRVIN